MNYETGIQDIRGMKEHNYFGKNNCCKICRSSNAFLFDFAFNFQEVLENIPYQLISSTKTFVIIKLFFVYLSKSPDSTEYAIFLGITTI